MYSSMSFEKCILPYHHYHTKNVEHFHHPSNSHTSLCSHSAHSTTTNVGLRQPLPSFCHSRLVLPFWEFRINEIICHILSSHKVNGKARETPSNRMGVTDMNLFGELALAQPELAPAILPSQHGTLFIARSCTGCLSLWHSVFTTTSLPSLLEPYFLSWSTFANWESKQQTKPLKKYLCWRVC